jgi:dienelactone hydrolase/pimeloyl-ACP methyl ester carboxylesterase
VDALDRREFLGASLAATLGTASAGQPARPDVHEQLLALAGKQQAERRARFAAVRTRAELEALQRSLRRGFLDLLDGFPPRAGTPPARVTGHLDGGDHVIDKIAFESFPGYFVSALLYRPRKLDGRRPAVLSPCGHSPVGKAEGTYQILHANLAKRGYVVLTYDPVGQGERSQFWDAARGRSRFNLGCGEHAVLGNPLYLLGTSLARYRIWDGLRAFDYLSSRPEVDPARIGCAGNSGGGTLTAYLAALEPRLAAAAICCYITTLPRRMANRVPDDPDSDPEQDIFGFVHAGIDHAGLLALIAPRPALLGTAQFDFFPIEGAKESFAEAQRLYQVAGVGKRIARAEAPARHGLTLPLRKAVYAWFDRWLAGKEVSSEEEIPVTPRPAKELQVCADGQVNGTLRSRSLLPLIWNSFQMQPRRPRVPLRDLLRLDRESADFAVTELAAGSKGLIVCINGNEARDWREEDVFLRAVRGQDYGVAVVDPRGVGTLRPRLEVRGHAYADPLSGVEENIAYNAFLVGRSLLGMRVRDVLAAMERLAGGRQPVVLCGRRDAALVACLAAAGGPAIGRVAVEDQLVRFESLFAAEGKPINAASILPGLLRDFGDMPDVLAAIAPRPVLLAAPVGTPVGLPASVQVMEQRWSADAGALVRWLQK